MQIPEGKVSTYGQIASMIPAPEGSNPDEYKRLGARWVGSAMRQTPNEPIPWHRVINSQGKISLPAGSTGAETQRRRLEREGVQFDEKERVNFKIVGWDGPSEDWLAENDLQPPRSLN